MIASNAIFSKNAHTLKAFNILIVLLFDLLEPCFGILLDVVQLFTRLEFDQNSNLHGLRDKPDIDVALSSSLLNANFLALQLEAKHEAKEENLINSLWSLLVP